MMWLVAPPKIICRSLVLVKAPLNQQVATFRSGRREDRFTGAAAFTQQPF